MRKWSFSLPPYDPYEEDAEIAEKLADLSTKEESGRRARRRSRSRSLSRELSPDKKRTAMEISSGALKLSGGRSRSRSRSPMFRGRSRSRSPMFRGRSRSRSPSWPRILASPVFRGGRSPRIGRRRSRSRSSSLAPEIDSPITRIRQKKQKVFAFQPKVASIVAFGRGRALRKFENSKLSSSMSLEQWLESERDKLTTPDPYSSLFFY